jgi:hypothetical protein
MAIEGTIVWLPLIRVFVVRVSWTRRGDLRCVPPSALLVLLVLLLLVVEPLTVVVTTWCPARSVQRRCCPARRWWPDRAPDSGRC